MKTVVLLILTGTLVASLGVNVFQHRRIVEDDALIAKAKAHLVEAQTLLVHAAGLLVDCVVRSPVGRPVSRR